MSNDSASQHPVESGARSRAEAVAVQIRVERADVFIVRLPLVRSLRTAYGPSSPTKRAIIVRLEDADGAVGWGEAPISERPVYGVDTAEGTWHALTDLLIPIIMHQSFDGPGHVVSAWSHLLGQHYAKLATESAIWAIASEKLNTSLATLWGATRSEVPVGESYGICNSVDALLGEVAARTAEGFARVKLKIAPGWDVAPVHAVRTTFPDLPVSVDANCGYDGVAGPWEELDELGMIMIEQPFRGDALLEMASLQRSIRTPICLDESASSVNTTRTALHLRAGQIVNIKPPRLGGLMDSMSVHDICVDQGVPAWCGGMLETGIGRAFNLSVAALPGFTMHADMSPARMFYEHDLVEPTFDIQPNGHIPVPTRPGNGFPIVEKRVEGATMRRWAYSKDS
jgi:O-succinylbenzoate synthase